MKYWKRAATALLAGILALNLPACHQEKQAEEIPEPPVIEEQPSKRPQVSQTSQKEQAGLVDSNLMLSRLKENLLSPLSVIVRTTDDSSVKVETTPELLEEIAGFICQNFTILRYDAAVDLSNSIYLRITGDKKIHDVYIAQWTDSEDGTHTFVQVEEGGVMGQYIYDPTTYDALLEVLQGWEYENVVTIKGKPYQLLTSSEYMDGLRNGSCQLKQLLQYGEQLVFHLDDQSLEGSIFEVIDTKTGDTIQTITTPKKALDIRSTDLDGYDFYIITEDSVFYRSSDDAGLKLDFSLPQTVQEKLKQGLDQPLFDVDYINDELVYVSEEGIVLSNQAGKRNDLLLRHDRLIQLLDLNAEDEEAPQSAEEQQEKTAVYAAPKLMNGGKLIVCPILLQGERDQWVGFSIFNLMNGSFKDYMTEFSDITGFSYPNEETLLVRGEKSYDSMNVLTREIVRKEWSSAVNENMFLCDLDELLIWRRLVNYSDHLLLRGIDTPEEETLLLKSEGDRFTVYGVTADYALMGWSDSQGDFMAVLSLESGMAE